MVPTEHRPYVHLPSETPTDALAKPCATARVSQRLQRGSPWAAVARLANGAQARAVRPATLRTGPGLYLKIVNKWPISELSLPVKSARPATPH